MADCYSDNIQIGSAVSFIRTRRGTLENRTAFYIYVKLNFSDVLKSESFHKIYVIVAMCHQGFDNSVPISLQWYRRDIDVRDERLSRRTVGGVAQMARRAVFCLLSASAGVGPDERGPHAAY